MIRCCYGCRGVVFVVEVVVFSVVDVSAFVDTDFVAVYVVLSCNFCTQNQFLLP